ncbi:MAG: hypothetical protein MI742_00320 [Desulfobacterales bacterium]|nr:hypothetical protein [Desulfobacterales bacterium]
MAHIQPKGITGLELAEKLKQEGRFSRSGSGLSVFGADGSTETGYSSDKEDVTVIGVKITNNWNIFAQVHPRNRFEISRTLKIF